MVELSSLTEVPKPRGGETLLRVRMALLTPMLGSQPANEEVFETYVKSKCPTEREENLNLKKAPEEVREDLEVQGTTIFHRNEEGELCLWDYQVKGFLKSRAHVIRARLEAQSKGTAAKAGWGSIKGKIDDHVFVYPEQIVLKSSNGKAMQSSEQIVERPLRARTAQGERICLARSEAIERGSSFEFAILIAGVVTREQIERVLFEAQRFGLGQWRNSGKGRCNAEILEVVEG